MPLEQLKKEGISYDFFYPQASLSAYWRFLSMVISIVFFRKANSLIVIQKVCSTRTYGRTLKWLVQRNPQATLYDLDDAEYYRQPTTSLHFFLKHCQWIQVGSQALADYARQFNAQVFVNTSPVPIQTITKKAKNDCLTLGWVGDFGNGKAISKAFAHKTSLFQLLFPVLKELPFPIKLVLVGVKKSEDIPLVERYFEDCPHISLEIPNQLDWTNDTWLYETILNFDLGVSPLVAHPFNIAKSAFKAKQYLSCGVPVIASAVGENGTFIQEGQNGRLCTCSNDWNNALSYFQALGQSDYSTYVEQALAGRAKFSLLHYTKKLVASIGDN